jgi:hypothetical protein
MAEPFDPYRKWLGIPPKDQPPHFYRLLGIATFEDDPDVIENAAARQMSHVRTFQTSKQHGAISQRILTELSAAKLCLLTPERKAEYDEQLQARLAAAGQLSSTDLTGAVAADGMDERAAAEPELPPLRREGETRWRMGAAVEAVSQPAPVPIPMPTVGSPVAAGAEGFPPIRRAGGPISTSRTYRKRSMLPVVLMLVSVIALAALGGVALIFANRQGASAHKSKSRPASSKDHPATPVSADKRAAANASATANPDTRFPVGTATSSIGNESTGKVLPSPPAVSASEITPTKPASPAERDELIDRMRQAIFRSEQALKERRDAEFQQHFTLAEQLVASKDLPEPTTFQQQVDDLRVLKQLSDEFWAAVRDNVLNKLELGERIEFRQHRFELIGREGDVVEYRLNDETRKHDIGQLEPKAAILIASKSIKWEEPATFLPIAAFLSVDGKVTDDAERKFGKQLFAIGRLIGQGNPAIARKLGVKDINEEIILDEDLANKVPLPEKKPEPE